MTQKKFIQHVYALHGLTPLQALVLAAFKDDAAQDAVTVASHMDGQHSLSRYAALKPAANEALKQLVVVGLVRVDACGWHWLVDAASTTTAKAKP
jgi:hypothetical protein